MFTLIFPRQAFICGCFLFKEQPSRCPPVSGVAGILAKGSSQSGDGRKDQALREDSLCLCLFNGACHTTALGVR